VEAVFCGIVENSRKTIETDSLVESALDHDKETKARVERLSEIELTSPTSVRLKPRRTHK
jgi:hypothetical protein